MTTSNSGNGTIIAAVIAAAAAILVAVLGQPFFLDWLKPLTCTKDFAFQAPSSGQVVNGDTGFVVIGTTCDPSDDQFGWIFEFDHEDRTYYSVSERPLSGEQWAVFDGPVGDAGDDHKNYRVVIIHGDRSCNEKLIAAVDGNDGWTSFAETVVPAGCAVGPGRDIVVNNKK